MPPTPFKTPVNTEEKGDRQARLDWITPGLCLKLYASSSFVWNWKVWTRLWTHLGAQGAESDLSSHRICYIRWSTAARTRRPAPTPRRWSTPPCSKQTAASPLGSLSVRQVSKTDGGEDLRCLRQLERCLIFGGGVEDEGVRRRRHSQEAFSYRNRHTQMISHHFFTLKKGSNKYTTVDHNGKNLFLEI